ncbi:MAG: 16S rRNA (adenine(1518)-N(6)/adenine(1519)-N(6))-dimethyltransferase RsmA [Verrucomicrobiota bacterium]
MTGKEIKEALDRFNVLPSKQMGQNFLIDPNMARWIVSQLDLAENDTVVEVGPGTGALTEHIVGVAKRVILIEFDARLAAFLKDRFAGEASVEVHHADGARFDVRQLFPHRPLKFLGNLPYSCGGAILKNLLSRPHPFQRAVIMLQKEVIDRLAATPGSKDYGMLSLRTQVDWIVEPQRTVPPEAFHPRPAIDSTVAIMRPRTEGLPAFDRRLFDELLRRGFAQRRKQLKKQLPDGVDWEKISQKLGVPTTARAEELDLTKWIALTRACDTHPLKDLPQKSGEIFDVVDEHDEVTSQATRSEVHAQGLLHRAVHVLVFNKRGDVLLQQRSMLKDAHPGVWDSSVSGHLDAGEAYETAAVRELAEEMGIEAKCPPTEIARLKPSAATGWEHIRLYRYEHQGNIRFPAAEIESAMWLPLSVLEAWIKARPEDFASGFLECWKASQR